jgi:hypothetical protein
MVFYKYRKTGGADDQGSLDIKHCRIWGSHSGGYEDFSSYEAT